MTKDIMHLARNVKPLRVALKTGGELASWHQGAHPFFKNSNGSPKVFWHAGTFTNDKDYVPDFSKTIGGGMHFGTEEAAKDRMQQLIENEDVKPSEMKMTQVHLNIKKPLILNSDAGEHWEHDIKDAHKKGHDGIIYKNFYEDPGSYSVIAFHPHQIKSATENNGNFDSSKPDIRESTGGFIHKSDGGDAEPSILDNEPKIELPHNLKELLSWKKDHAPPPSPSLSPNKKQTMDEIFTSPQSGYEGAPPIMMPSSLQEILKFERVPHKSEGGSLSERRAAAQAKIKELSAQLRNHAPGTPEHDALKQAIKDQGQIVAQKNETPPQKEIGIGHNNPPEETPIRVTNALGTYSHAAEVAENSNVDRMSPSEWIKFLANKPGVKKEELRWADIAGMTPAPGEKTVSKKQVARRLEDANLEDYTENVRNYKYSKDENGDKLNRAERSRAIALDALKDPDLFKEIFGENNLGVDQDLHYAEENLKSQGFTGELLQKKLAEHLVDSHSYDLNRYHSKIEPKFESYTLKGKDNNENYREIVAQYKPDHPLFKYETHYPEDNPLFHLRLADLHTPEGKKLLHVEEVQGDWGQQGRGKFSNEKIDKNFLRKEYEKLDEEHDRASEEFRIAKNAFYDKLQEPIRKRAEEHNKRRYNDEGNMTDEWRNTPLEERRRIENEHYAEQDRLQEEIDKKIRQHRDEDFAGTEVEPFYKKKREVQTLTNSAWHKYNNAKDTIPEGPHVTETKAWTKLAVKRILKEAAEGGYHGIVLTPGSEQSKRWSGQPGVQQFYDETLEPMLDKELKSHDPDAGKSSQPFLMKATKRIDSLDHQAIAEIMGMPIPTNDTERTDVQNAWYREPNAQQLRDDWESSGKNFRTTEKPLPTFNMTPKAAASIPNNQRLFKRGGMIPTAVAKSRNIVHNPAIIGLALSKIRSMPRDNDSTSSGKQGRLF